MAAVELSKAELQLISALRAKGREQVAPTRPPCIWLYARYSHLDSQEGGLSESVQTMQVKQYAELLNSRRDTPLPIREALVDEAVSARKVHFRKRERARQIWAGARQGDVLVIARLDRAFRSVADMSFTVNKLMDRGVEIHFVRENISFDQAHGKLLAHVLAAVAQWHSDVLSERNKEIAAELKRRGRPNGRPYMWEKYEGTKGSKIKVVLPDVWYDSVTIYVAHERHKWSWVTISDYMDAVGALREKRDLIPRHSDLAREWNRRRVWRAYKNVQMCMKSDESIRFAVNDLVRGPLPLDQVGRYVAPPLRSGAVLQGTVE